MPFTVHDLLKLPLLSGAHLIAGQQGIDRIIKSISFMEAPDSVNWVMPHDFLITNAYLFSANPDFEQNLIKKLAEKKVSAIGIKLNRYLTNVPAEIKNQSNEVGLPVIILPYNVTPSELISTISKTLNSLKISQKKGFENPHISLLCELLFSTNVSDTTMLRRASSLGWDFTKSSGIVVLRINNLNLIKQVVSCIQNYNYFHDSHVFQYEKEIIILYGVDTSIDIKTELIKYGKEIQTSCKKELPDVIIQIGIGRSYYNILDLRKSYEEAVHALNFGPLLDKTNSIISFDNLGVFKLLCKFNNHEELEKYFGDSVENLIKYDQEYNTEYYKTVKTFCKCNQNINETAKQLSVHYNTVKYRINHIKKVLNINLEDSEKVLEIQIGIKITDYLRLVHKNYTRALID